MRVYLKAHSVRGDGAVTVFLWVGKAQQRRRKMILRVAQKHWDEKKLRVKISHPQFSLYNRRIGEALSKAERIAMEREGVAPDELIALLSAPDHSSKTFSEVALIDLAETPPKSWNTIRVRKSAILRFAEWRNIPAGRITSLVMEQYKAHMLSRGVSHNTAATQLRMLRTVYRRVCRRLGEDPRNILDGVGAVEHYGAVPQMPTVEEVRALQVYADGQTGWLAKAVHMWLFSHYSAGIRWADLCRLTVQQIAGGRVVIPVQSKSDRPKNIKLRPQAARIASLYTTGDYVFAINGEKPPSYQHIASANVKANKALKVAAKACGISLRMHTHNSRHTYMAQGLKHRVDDRILQRSMGIGDKAFKHYRAQFPQSDVDDANDLIFEEGG